MKHLLPAVVGFGVVSWLGGAPAAKAYPHQQVEASVVSPGTNHRLDMPLQQTLGGIWKAKSGHLQPTGLYRRKVDDSEWLDIQVPSNWYTEGHDFSGSVWFRKRFSVPDGLSGRMATLVFEGVDYAADVWLNDQYLGFHEGYFAPFSFDVSNLLEVGGNNILAVRVDSPFEKPGPSWSLHKRLVKGIFGHHDARPGGAWSARGQEQNTGGIWAETYLSFTDLVRIRALTLEAKPGNPPTDPDSRAVLDVRVTLDSRVKARTEVEVEFQVSAEQFLPSHPPFLTLTLPFALQPGESELSARVPCAGANLWWPWDRGKPRLYRVSVTIRKGDRVLATSSDLTGFRTIDFEAEKGLFQINGERYFLRGTNYIATQWLSQMDRDSYGHDLELMRRAHINAVRVHAHIGAKSLYREADRRGMLIWQDFPLQWGYEESPELHQAVMTQAVEMTRHLFNHPSIFIWSGHNEPPWDADWMQYKYTDYLPGQNQRLDRDLAETLANADPTRPVHAVSSTSEHPWLGWYSGTWTDYQEPTDTPLVTEFGAQALPHIDSLRSFIPVHSLWPETDADWAPWSFHNFQRKETFEIAGVARGEHLRDWVANTQEYQSELIQLAAESYRRQRFAPVGGIFQFMFVECWPSIGWAMVGHDRRPKPSYYALQTAFQPLLPSIEWTRRAWPAEDPAELALWVINDFGHGFVGAWLSYAILEDDTVLFENRLKIDVGADSATRIATVASTPSTPGTYELWVRLEAEGLWAPATNHLTFEVLPPGLPIGTEDHAP